MAPGILQHPPSTYGPQRRRAGNTPESRGTRSMSSYVCQNPILVMPSEHDFRRIALGLDRAVESSLMGHPDFRAHGRIFVTLQHDRAWGGLMLTPAQQKQFMKDYPKAFK